MINRTVTIHDKILERCDSSLLEMADGTHGGCTFAQCAWGLLRVALVSPIEIVEKKRVELGCDQPRVETLGFQHLDRLELFLLVDFRKSMISADVKGGRCATDSH